MVGRVVRGVLVVCLSVMAARVVRVVVRRVQRVMVVLVVWVGIRGCWGGVLVGVVVRVVLVV